MLELKGGTERIFASAVQGIFDPWCLGGCLCCLCSFLSAWRLRCSTLEMARIGKGFFAHGRKELRLELKGDPLGGGISACGAVVKGEPQLLMAKPPHSGRQSCGCTCGL